MPFQSRQTPLPRIHIKPSCPSTFGVLPVTAAAYQLRNATTPQRPTNAQLRNAQNLQGSNANVQLYCLKCCDSLLDFLVSSLRVLGFGSWALVGRCGVVELWSSRRPVQREGLPGVEDVDCHARGGHEGTG